MKVGKNGKVCNQGVTCIVVGYVANLDGDCYHMSDLNAEIINKSYGVICLKLMSCHPKKTEGMKVKMLPDIVIQTFDKLEEWD